MSSIYDYSGNAIAIAEGFEPYPNDIPSVSITGELPTNKTDGEYSITIGYYGSGVSFIDYATAKVQGDSSQQYPKKNYTIKLFSDSAHTKKDKRVFRDWEKANKFVLKANWVDHSHARNIVNARLWTQIVQSRSDFGSLPSALTGGHMAIDGFPVKVFANGVYMGIYTWNVPKSALYGLDDDVDTNVLIQGDSASYSGSILFRAANDAENKWSDETHDTKPTAVTSGWNRVLNFVYTSTDSAFTANFENYFDKQSIIDQYIFLLTGCIVDNLAKNQTFFSYDAQKWYGGMYDMDGTWGLPPFPPNKSTWYDATTVMQTGYTVCTDGGGATNLFYERVGNRFASNIATRYAELRASVLSASNILAEFDRFMSTIPASLYAEDYASTTGNGQFTNIPLKSEDHVQQIRTFVKNRLAYTDSLFA